MSNAELATYDQAKHMLMKICKFHHEAKLLHILSANFAGFFAVLIASPLDVIKTRIMNVNYIFKKIKHHL